MAKIRIRKDNPSGRTADILDVFGEQVKVGGEWVEIDDADVKALCLNPILYEVEGEKLVKADDKEKKPKHK